MSTLLGLLALIYLLIIAFNSLRLGYVGIGEALVQIVTGTLPVAGIPYGWVKLNSLRDKLGFILIIPIIGWIFYLIKAKELIFDRK